MDFLNNHSKSERGEKVVVDDDRTRKDEKLSQK